MSYKINLGNWNSVFVVPSAIVDKHIKLVGAVQLKVLMWVLRHAGEDCEVEGIAKDLSMHPADVKDAMQYWIENDIIIFKDQVLRPADSLEKLEDIHNDQVKETVVVNLEKEEVQKRARPPIRHTKPNAEHVSKRMAESEEIKCLMHEAEVILARTLSQGDLSLLVMFHDDDGLPVDVILMLLQYSVSVGKNNMKYIERVAIDWGKNEIDTIEKAEARIRLLEAKQKAWNLVEKIVGLEHRKPTSDEEEITNRWVNEWGYKEELIKEAYERCVKAKGKYIARYMDKIIKSWHIQGIYTLEGAMNERKRQDYKKQKHTPSYDIDQYEKESLFDYKLI